MTENKPNSEVKNTAANGQNTSPDKNAATKAGAENSDSVKETLNKVKDTAGQAVSQVAGKAQEKASELLGDQKTNLAAGINTIAESVRHIGEDLQNGGEKNQVAAFAGQYGSSLADQIEKVSHYVEGKDFREIARDAEQFARRNPAVFVGGAFALGLLTARIFKSSGRANGHRQLKVSEKKTSSETAAVQAS